MSKYAFGLLLLSSQAFAGLDYQCMDDCSDRRYSFQYCQQVCTIQDERQSGFNTARPVDAFIRGQQARQEYEARELELERMRAETLRAQAENERRQAEAEKDIWADVAEHAAAIEMKRLKAENEALRKKLEEAKPSTGLWCDAIIPDSIPTSVYESTCPEQAAARKRLE